MKIMLSIIFVCSAFLSFAQVNVEDPGVDMFRSDSTGHYFKSKSDSGCIVFYCPNSFCYKKLNKKGMVMVEGDLISTCVDCREKQGEWKEYDENGKIKSIQNYYSGQKIGDVYNYYPGGKLKEKYSLALWDGYGRVALLSGSYYAYFSSGKLKESGYYKLKLDTTGIDTIYTENIETGEIAVRLQKYPKAKSVKCGTWKFFNEKGHLLRKEEYR